METLVFVHGFLGGAAQWADQVRFFEPHFQVVTPDLPGFGDRKEEQACDSIAGFAQTVLDDLSRQNIQKFHLIGHSMGGMIAQQMAFMAPERLLSKVFYSTGPVGALPDRFEPIATSMQKVHTEGTEVTGRRISASWFLQGAADPAYEDCAALAVLPSEQAMLAGLKAMQDWSGVDQLAALQGATLVLWGDQDRTYPWRQPEQLWQGITGAHLAVVPQVAHAVHLEKSKFFNDILLAFLTSSIR